jgi:Spy/CpxP family protein refolding chaperone
MKKLFLISLVVAVMIGAVSFSAMAFGKGPGQGGGNRFLNGLNLTSDQQQKILEIRQGFEKETLSVRQDLQKKMTELRQLWAADQLNQGQIDAKNKEITGIRIQLTTKSRAMMEKIKAVLTPDQLKQWNDKEKNFKDGSEFKGKGSRGEGCYQGGGF